jgi:hypothetical protein
MSQAAILQLAKALVGLGILVAVVVFAIRGLRRQTRRQRRRWRQRHSEAPSESVVLMDVVKPSEEDGSGTA